MGRDPEDLSIGVGSTNNDLSRSGLTRNGEKWIIDSKIARGHGNETRHLEDADPRSGGGDASSKRSRSGIIEVGNRDDGPSPTSNGSSSSTLCLRECSPIEMSGPSPSPGRRIDQDGSGGRLGPIID